MANNEKNWLFIFGSIIGLAGFLLSFVDDTLSMWQLVWPDLIGNPQYAYLNAFGILSYDTETYNLTEFDATVLYATIIALVGILILFIAGAKGSKMLGLLGTLALIGGLGYFGYSYVMFIDGNTSELFLIVLQLMMDAPEGFNVLWGSNGDIAWRIGNGFFIVFGGAIISVFGVFKKN